MSNRKALITGDRGFIGGWLREELARGFVVVGHDFDQGDLTVPGVFLRALGRHEPDVVVHLAAQVGRLFGEDDIAHTVQSNAQMTSLVAHACGQRGIPVMYASSSEIYGDFGDESYHEDVMPNLPRNLYGLTKRWGEEVLELYAPERLMICRLSMPYGPGAPPGRGRRAMDNFLWWAHHRREITAHRGAERSWCHISDTVRGLRYILEDTLAGPARGPEAYNVGRSDRPLSMVQLAVRACELAHAPLSLISEVDPPERQIAIKRLDTSKLAALGWVPQTELEEGMAGLYEWIKQFDQEGKRRMRLV